MSKPTTNLSDMEYDEVSLVALAANQEADVVLFKSAKRKARCDHSGLAKGEACADCGYVNEPTSKTVRKSQRPAIIRAKVAIARSKRK